MEAASSGAGGAQKRRSSNSTLSPSMLAIMESQVAEMRKQLMSFKVCSAADAGVASGGQLPDHADILVFGPSGSGKSSLIRTFYMALHNTAEVSGDFAKRIVVKDTALNEGTLKYVSAVIKPEDPQRGTSALICHDTRGHIWMDEKEQRQLGVIMDGGVRDDSIVQQRNFRYARLLWEFWKSDSELFPREILVQRSGLSTKPHALLFVFDGSMEEIPNGDEETQFYREIIEMSRLKGYVYPQVVLTRIDRVERQIPEGVDSAEAELRLRQLLDKKIEDVVLRLGVSRSSVHFIENYHSDAEARSVSVDIHALRILQQCCQRADVYLLDQVKGQRGYCSVQ